MLIIDLILLLIGLAPIVGLIALKIHWDLEDMRDSERREAERQMYREKYGIYDTKPVAHYSACIPKDITDCLRKESEDVASINASTTNIIL